MAGRQFLLTVVVLSGALHAGSIARSFLPAQDGLKFIRVARQFQNDPWPDVVRGTDQHPLYPAFIALAEPVVGLFSGQGPETWRIAAQLVATLASLAILFPLHALARTAFDARIAGMAVAIYALLPAPAEVGHDTLSDSLGLLFILFSLHFGARAIANGDWRPALAAGLAGGAGYLTRPEAILAPLSVCLAWGLHWASQQRLRPLLFSPVAPSIALSALAIVGGYALVKGQVSEKLSMRYGAALGAQTTSIRQAPQRLPRGLEHKRLDFSAKDDAETTPVRSPWKVLRLIAIEWTDELCWGFAIMTVWGLLRRRFILSVSGTQEPEQADGRVVRLMLMTFSAVYILALVRHTSTLGYISGRHTLALVAISMPWAAAGTFICLRGLAIKLPWSSQTAWVTGVLAAGAIVVVLATYQLRIGHPSRKGHWAAGQWLAAHRQPNETVLDTRGWARFLSQAPGYDYWHVRQALTDSHLSYVVVGQEELESGSARARTLSALLAYAATPLRDFPAFQGDRNVGVRLFRFHQPGSWEGLVP